MGERKSERSLADWDQRRALVQELRDPKAAADVAGEALRWLNHLLGRFESAVDVYSVVGQLAYCEERLPQAVDGMVAFLERQLAVRRLRREDGGDAAESVAAFAAAGAQAKRAVTAAAAALHRAQRAISGVGGVPEEHGG